MKIDGLTISSYDNMQNPRSAFEFCATNKSELLADGSADWDTPYANRWFGIGITEGLQTDFVWNSECRSWDLRSFDQIFDEMQKDSIFFDYFIVFDVPSSKGFSQWRNQPKGNYYKVLKIR